MSIKNTICRKFERQINDEIAAGLQFDYVNVEALKSMLITVEGKRRFGVAEEVPLTLYEVTKSSVDVLGKLRFVYLLSLLEAFGSEYIAQRESISLDEVPQQLSTQKSKWQRKQRGVLSSTSFLNPSYLSFVLQERYSIDFSSVTQQCFWEAGVLRNCLMHHSGTIPNEVFRAGLRETISIAGAVDSVGCVLVISDTLVWMYIEAARAFLRACNY